MAIIHIYLQNEMSDISISVSGTCKSCNNLTEKTNNNTQVQSTAVQLLLLL